MIKDKIRRGEIKVYNKNTIRIVTHVYGEETIDFFTFDEVLKFIENNSKQKHLNTCLHT